MSENKLMTRRLTNGMLLMLTVFMLIFTSCDKEKAEPTPTAPETPPASGANPSTPDNPQVSPKLTCSVAEVVHSDKNYGADPPRVYSYDESGYLNKITYTYTGDKGVVKTEVTTFTYNAGQLTRKELHVNGELKEFWIYEYTDGVLTSFAEYVNVDNKGILRINKTFKYDDKKRVIETADYYSGRMEYTSKYSYDSNGNVEKVLLYDYKGDPSFMVIYSNYDDKLTPFAALKGIQVTADDDMSKNNAGSKVVYYDHERKSVSYYMTFTYEYNSSGFPIKITRKDDKRDEYLKTYTYKCK